MMTKNEEITILSGEIIDDLTNASIPLNIAMLKASKLALLVDMPKEYKWLMDNASSAESSESVRANFNVKMESTKDPAISVSSANPNEIIGLSLAAKNNAYERSNLAKELEKAVNWVSYLRNGTFKFALGIYTKWRFGNVAESIFEQKRARIEPVLFNIFTDIEQRLNSITQNMNSENPEDWKNAVSSCRTLFMDIAEIVNPAKEGEDKGKYMNRIKDFISPKQTESKTKGDLLSKLLEELKSRIEYSLAYTQGGSHNVRVTKTQAQDVVLYTYLALGEIAGIYANKNE